MICLLQMVATSIAEPISSAAPADPDPRLETSKQGAVAKNDRLIRRDHHNPHWKTKKKQQNPTIE